MKNQMKKVLALTTAVVMTSAMFVGCGSKEAEQPAEAATETAEETAAEEITSAYFTKGVYANYSSELDNPTKDYFYVFSDESTGFTDDGVSGLPFSCTQEDGKVSFSFGGEGEDLEVFTVTEVKDGLVYGYFDGVEDKPLVFEPLADADPDNFSATNYLSDGTDFVYNDANGWSVHYNPKAIEVTTEGNKTAFVYTGDCAGTCMVMSVYDVDMNGKEKCDAMAKEYGSNATVSDGIFPGTEDVKGYWVGASEEAEQGSSIHKTAIIRDYMDGYLMFEFVVHNSGDEAIDMPVSDNLATVIDSIQFN